MNTLKILDLFAGVGGLSLGFELVENSSGEHIFELHRAVEIDKYACETLRSRYDGDKVIEGDITKLSVSTRIINECKGKVSVIVGGIPCQSFSLLGSRSGYGKKNVKFKEDIRDNLYEHFRYIVAKIKPNIIVIENVKGMLSKKDKGGKLIISKIISDFEQLGYNLENEKGEKYNLLNAANFGVPQRRERIIFIGVKKNWKNIKIPLIKTTHYDPASKDSDQLRNSELLPFVTLFEAIGDLPEVHPKITTTGLSISVAHRIKKKNETVYSGEDKIELDKKRYENHLMSMSESGKKYFQTIRHNGYKYIDHHISRSQQVSDIKLFGLMKEGETAGEFLARCPKKADSLIKYDMSSFLDKYRKQNFNSVCTTVFAHLEKDGNRFIHPKQNRTFTPREAARIQSFPDDFVFSGPISKKFRQIGNAVPPLLGKAIGEAVLRIL